MFHSSSSHPLISVLLPVRDGAATVGDALRSVSEQTLADLEVIVIDDGSRDDTSAVLRAWQERDCRVQLLRNPRRGIVSALQSGLARARAPYIARMDADDISRPDRLRKQFEFLQRSPDVAGCGTGVTVFPASAASQRAREYAGWINSMTSWPVVEANLFVECPLAHPTFMFRAEVLRSLEGYRDCGWPEDYDLILRLWRAGHRFYSLPGVYLDWRHGEGRTSRNHPAYSLGAFRACRVHHLRRSLLKGKKGVVIWGAGPTGKKLALEFQRQDVRVVSFVDVDPRKIGQTVHSAPVREPAFSARFGGSGDVLHIGAVARAVGREKVRRTAAEVLCGDGHEFVSMA